MTKIPLATFEKVLKDMDPKIRVSHSAAEALVSVITHVSKKISQDATELAKHSNRKTVMGGDVFLAAKKLGFFQEKHI